MNFEEYLVSKKINSTAFQSAEPERWLEWNTIFIELSPASFTAQKLYLINPIRRKYPLTISEAEKKDSMPDVKIAGQKPASAKPVFKPKMK